MVPLCRRIVVLACLAGALGSVSDVRAQWGDVTGKIEFSGEIPSLPPKVVGGDAAAKDAAVCAAAEIPYYPIKIDPASKGLADVFVYVRRPAKVNPELAAPPTDPLVVDQKNCTFIPHAMIVRVGQQVIAKSEDSVAHNLHGYNVLNPGFNFTVSPNDREGQMVPIEKANAKPELLPIAIKCDIHPHMEGYWWVTDNPYAALTDAEGNFTIKGLPAGKNTLTIWHSSVGYVAKTLDVTVPPGGTAKIDPIKVEAKKKADGSFDKLVPVK